MSPKRRSTNSSSTAARASASVWQISTPFPAARTSAFSTAGYEAQARCASASSRVRRSTCEAVGTPTALISSFA